MNLFSRISEALEYYASVLTEYEKKEILNYSEVWFLGLNARKIRAQENNGINLGYDDENGNYNKVKLFFNLYGIGELTRLVNWLTKVKRVASCRIFLGCRRFLSSRLFRSVVVAHRR